MRIFLVPLALAVSFFLHAQEPLKIKHSPLGIFSAGLRSFAEMPDIKNAGQMNPGVGAQARLQLSSAFQSEYAFGFARGKWNDWISTTDLHFYGEIIFYPVNKLTRIQPYLLFGPGVTYSIMNDLVDSISISNWKPGAVAGIASHINLSSRFDISLAARYVAAYGKKLAADTNPETQVSTFSETDEAFLESGFRFELSLNYKLKDLW